MFTQKIILVACLALVLSACGSDSSTKKEEKKEKKEQQSMATPQKTPVQKTPAQKESVTSGTVQLGDKGKIEYSEKKVTISGEKGENITIDASDDAKVPTDFPQDIYVPAGVQVKQSLKMDDGFHLILESKDAVAKVVADFKENMVKKDWKEEAAIDSEQGSMLEYSQGEKRSVLVHIIKEEAVTSIMLMVTQE